MTAQMEGGREMEREGGEEKRGKKQCLPAFQQRRWVSCLSYVNEDEEEKKGAEVNDNGDVTINDDKDNRQ